ncbi:RNase adapter RapZ [Biformimicrobium ophioploci]|uniref:RNase adapter RapZ n=1 Tax=Biformimicrobium ophioploci TaxID=3036711 RepID=A0ABQ6LX25_9GAMM|nr:RNase adapter RapZ [Microbulbifer sp. NKW57]
MQLLEDVGFNCIDNLPASLLPELVGKVARSANEGSGNARLALGIDVRNPWSDLKQAPEVIEKLRGSGVQCDVIYLDARAPTLIRRFSETRRKHPLTDENTHLSEALEREKDLLAPIAALADLVIDTSGLSLHQLREQIKNRVVGHEAPGMAVLFQSFGFKHGVPLDADLVFDCRCLPNPYWMPELRSKTGADSEVAEFLLAQPETTEMLDDIATYLKRWLPRYQNSNRSYTCIGIGCTGGRHRSVFVAERLAEFFKDQFPDVQVKHREQAEH